MNGNFFKTSYLFAFICSTILLFQNSYAQSETLNNSFDSTSIVASGAKVELVAKDFIFTEGPAVDQDGNIYFTDQPNDAIWKWNTNGTLTLFKQKTGRSNGLFIDKENQLFACADSANEIWRFTKDGAHVVVYSPLKNNLLNGPNDLWINAKGHIFFTDPFYARPWWQHKEKPRAAEAVYLLRNAAAQPVMIENTLKKPNGIVGTPDGKYLFIADIGDSKTYKYKIKRNGKLRNKKLFVEKGSDGITLDEKGNLYITGKGVSVYDAQGKYIAQIDVPSDWTANVCFGGTDKKTLFITAREGVYTLQMNVAGVE